MIVECYFNVITFETIYVGFLADKWKLKINKRKQMHPSLTSEFQYDNVVSSINIS